MASASAADETIVVLDRGRSESIAKERCSNAGDFFNRNQSEIKRAGCAKVAGCSELKSTFDACAAVPSGGVVEFEDRVAAQFKADPICKGARLILDAANYPGPHWKMNIDYVPGAPKQAWSLRANDSASLIVDDGNPKQIAEQLCFILVDRGVRRKPPQ